MKRRLPYIIICLILLGVEVLIALFVDDKIIRPFGGDVIVIWVIYCFVQAILGGRNNHYIVAGGVLIFAFLVEFLQFIHIIDILGLRDIEFFRVLIGTNFSWPDLLCYTIGAAACWLGTWLYGRIKGKAGA